MKAFLILTLLAVSPFALAQALLTPGSTPGWPATPVPPRQGDPDDLGYDMEPVALFATPCFTTYKDQTQTITVNAFHPNGARNGNCGIEKIRFIANNGPPVDVTAPSVNPATGYWEWWVRLAPRDQDGPVEVRAVVYPISGKPIVLQGDYRTRTAPSGPPHPFNSVVLWSNARGTYDRTPLYVDDDASGGGDGSSSRPYRTIHEAIMSGWGGNSENGVIYCKPGSYRTSRQSGKLQNESRWLTIRPAPGVARSQVFVNEGDGTSYNRSLLIRFQDVTIDRSAAGTAPIGGASNSLRVTYWLDGAEVIGAGREGLDVDVATKASSVVPAYFTKSATNRARIRDIRFALLTHHLMQGCDVFTVSGDLANVRYARDCVWWDQRRVGEVHGDWAQTSQSAGPNSMWLDNLVYDVSVQLIFQTDTIENNRRLAFVNNILFKEESDVKGSFIGRNDGSIYWHNTLGNQRVVVSMDLNNNHPSLAPNYGVEKSNAVSFYGNIFRNLVLQNQGSIDESNFTRVVDEIEWAYNHYNSGTWMPGDHRTSGIVRYENPDQLDWLPVAPAALATPDVPRIIPWDQRQRPRNALTLRGALESSTGPLPPSPPAKPRIFLR